MAYLFQLWMEGKVVSIIRDKMDGFKYIKVGGNSLYNKCNKKLNTTE